MAAQREWHIHARRDHFSTCMNEPLFMYTHNLKRNLLTCCLFACVCLQVRISYMIYCIFVPHSHVQTMSWIPIISPTPTPWVCYVTGSEHNGALCVSQLLRIHFPHQHLLCSEQRLDVRALRCLCARPEVCDCPTANQYVWMYNCILPICKIFV